MLIRLCACMSILLAFSCQSENQYGSSSGKRSVKGNAKNSGSNAWLITDRHSEKYRPKSKASSNKVVENVTMEQWNCPRPETARYMPRSTKMKIRHNMRLINDELDGSQSNSGRTISQVVLKKGKARNP
jgi:hypothetical protein